MVHKSSKEARYEKAEISEKIFLQPQSTSESAKRFFRMPPYYGTALCTAASTTTLDER